MGLLLYVPTRAVGVLRSVVKVDGRASLTAPRIDCAEEQLLDTSPDESPTLAEQLDLPEQLDDVAPVGGPLRLPRMTGSSIAGRDAAAWITDFLNGAYYRRPVEDREVDDLRLAFCVLTTYWYRKGRGPLRLTDLRAFHRAFGAGRFDTELAARGRLNGAPIFEGAAGMFGDCFPDAYRDDARRGWGIAFETADEKGAYDPGRRLKLARLGGRDPGSPGSAS